MQPNYLSFFPSAAPLSNATSPSNCFNQASLKTSSENLLALSRERRRMARVSSGDRSRALAKPSANSSGVEAWKPMSK